MVLSDLTGVCLGVGSALLLAGAAAAGCSRQSNVTPPGTTAAGITSAALYTPQGPFPRGQAGPGSAPGPQGPRVELLAPARGAQLGAGPALLELQVSDPQGVATVSVGGTAASDQGGGRWTVPLAPTPGLNVVEVQAVDGAGSASRCAFSLVQGQFLPPGSEVPGAAAARLGQAALDLVAARVEAAAAGLDLLSLIGTAPVVSSALVRVDVTALTHAPPRVTRLTPAATGLQAALALDALQVELAVDLIGRGLVYVSADRATVTLEAAIAPAGAAGGPLSGAQLLGLRVDRLDVVFQNLAIRARSGLADAILTPFKGLILTAIRAAVERALRDALPGLLTRPLPGVDQPLTIQVPVPEGGTRALEVRGRLTGGQGWPGVALDLETALTIAAGQPLHAGTSLGILVRAPARPASTTQAGPDEVEVALSEDAACALAHAYWHAGGARYVLDGTQPTTSQAPLAARLLHPFFPLVRDLAPDPATPVVIEAALEAPPLVRLGAPPGSVHFLAPEAELRVWLDYMDGGPRLEVLRARLTLELAAQVDVVGTELVFSQLRCGRLGMDVTDEPAGDLDEQEVEDFLVVALPIVVDNLTLPRVPIPALPAGVPLVAPTLEAREGWLMVRGRVR